MPLIQLIIVLGAVGLILWLLNTYIPMDKKLKRILTVIMVIAMSVYILWAFGILDSMPRMNSFR